MKRNRSAFSLVETLIALGIVGIVVALSLPILIRNYQEKATIVRLKKVYTILSQIYERVTLEYGTPDEWDISTDTTDTVRTEIYYEKMKNSTNRLAICEGSKCSAKYYGLNGNFDGNANYRIAQNPMILADGTHVRILGTNNTDCSIKRGQTNALASICAEVFVDVNAQKPPNTYGKDVFVFYWTKYGIIPAGSSKEQSHVKFELACSKSTDYVYSGAGCAAWVLENENMDYLHCQGLSWSGKKSCKN